MVARVEGEGLHLAELRHVSGGVRQRHRRDVIGELGAPESAVRSSGCAAAAARGVAHDARGVGRVDGALTLRVRAAAARTRVVALDARRPIKVRARAVEHREPAAGARQLGGTTREQQNCAIAVCREQLLARGRARRIARCGGVVLVAWPPAASAVFATVGARTHHEARRHGTRRRGGAKFLVSTTAPSVEASCADEPPESTSAPPQPSSASFFVTVVSPSSASAEPL